MRPLKTDFRKDIEGLRAVAVLLVIAYHARLFGCRGGFVGVDIFFVLSGYLITGLLRDEIVRTDKIALVEFYARRIRRLLPASAVMLFGVMIAASFILSPFEQTSVSKSAVATLAYLSNVYFARGSNDYFAANMSENPLLHTWSLGVEEQFYVLWPILIWLIFRLRPSRRALGLAMVVIAIISFTVEVHLTRTNQPLAFFLMPSRAWEFAVGGLMSQLPVDDLRRHPILTHALGWAGLITILGSGIVMSPADFPGTKVAIPVLAAAAVLIAGVVEGNVGVGNLLGTKWLQYLGQRSYVLYLWHWPVLVLAAVVADRLSFRSRVGCVLLSIFLAELTHRVVENPVRFSTYLRAHAKLCVAGSVVIMLAGVSVASAWRSWSMHTRNYITYGGAMLDLSEDRSMKCVAVFGESIPRECDFGDVAASKTVVLFGDSHMEQWLPAFQDIAKRSDWKIVLFAKSGCPALAILIAAKQAKGEDQACSMWRGFVIDRIRKMHPAAVVLSNAIEYNEIELSKQQSPAEWRIGAQKTFETLRTANAPLVFMRDTPWPHYDVTLCLARANWNGFHKCPEITRAEAVNDEIYSAEINGSESVAKVSFVDLSDDICGRIFCEPRVGDAIIYRDSNHLTATFLRGLSTHLYDALVRAVPALAR